MKLAALFSHHLVIQQGQPVPVWGWGEPGERVRVTLAGATADAVAGEDGAWRAMLPALPAGGPHEMVISGSTTITLRDVLIGEVWVCSGQSNMEWPVQSAANGGEEVAAAQHPNIRLFTVPKCVAMAPEAEVDGQWTVCTPESIPLFSAVGYFFGRALQQALDVPVGLIHTSWGGTPAEAWTSREGLQAEPALRSFVDDLDAVLPRLEEVNAEYQVQYKAWADENIPTDPGNSGYPQGWADPATDTHDWPEMELPQNWQRAGLNFNGVVWFRKEVEIPAAWAGQPLELRLAPIDKSDTTYLNNVEVGGLNFFEDNLSWCTPRCYAIPAELAVPGTVVVAVRAFSHMYGAGFGQAGPDQMCLCAPGLPDAAPIPLTGPWQYQVEANFGLINGWCPIPVPPGPTNAHTPSGLYNAMIAPLLPYGIRGAIWYQGESNAARAEQYRTLFPAMIRDWRRAWGQGDFPFYFVQLANFRANMDADGRSPWAELREAQTLALREPHTGMAVAIDIGNPVDIHPTNKQDVGQRLALNALALTYGQPDVAYAGPTYRGMTVDGAAIRLAFDHGAGGLRVNGDALLGFTIAGADRRFVPAEAVIDGDTVLVSSPQVPAPVAIRYGWAESPACTLANQAGLPATPFRTDTWPFVAVEALAATAAN